MFYVSYSFSLSPPTMGSHRMAPPFLSMLLRSTNCVRVTVESTGKIAYNSSSIVTLLLWVEWIHVESFEGVKG